MQSVKLNSPKAWLLASRPKTLAAGSVPVLVATSLAIHYGYFKLIPAVLCLLFALLSQIASNFSNDYFDYKKNTDNETRLGPPRAVSSGWIKPDVMLKGIFITVALACFIGLGLVFYGGWQLIIVGLICVISLIAYTAGPWPLAYNGLGDLFVLVFFGFVSVGFSFYVQTLYFNPYVFICGASVGLGAVNILVLNNYRDRDTDKVSRKNTTIVLFGENFGKWFYLINGFIAVILCLYFITEKSYSAAFLPLVYLIPHIKTWKKMVKINKGKELNILLGETAGNLLLFGILLSMGLLL